MFLEESALDCSNKKLTYSAINTDKLWEKGENMLEPLSIMVALLFGIV